MKKNYMKPSVCSAEECKTGNSAIPAVVAAIAGAAASTAASSIVGQLLTKDSFSYNQSINCTSKVEMIYE